MRKIREVLRLAFGSTMSRRSIAQSLGMSRDAVADYLVRAQNAGLSWPLPEDLDDQQLEHRLYPPLPATGARRAEPGWAEVHRELKLPGATLQALHDEYLAANPNGMQRSQFCNLYRRWCRTLKTYMREVHAAGDKVFVDYAGPTMSVHDAATGQVFTAQIFVGTLGASNYTYAEATWSQKLPDWIAANVRMLEFFGGTPNFIVCDNLKSGVTRPSLTEPLVNESYQNFAAHYGTTILPTRPHRPKDKAKVEGHVLIVERWIRFQIRKRVFTSLGELNDAIRELLIHLNAKPFQKLPGSRASSFEATDKPALQKLPTRPYEYVEFRRARVGMDKMIDVDGRLFSVPAKLVSEEVDIRVTSSAVEVMHAGRRVASHIRTPGNKPVIDQTHLTAADQAYGMWSPEREIEWAKSVGSSTVEFVSQRLAASGNKTMGYRLGMGMRKLASEYGDQRMETTCKRALESGATRVSSLRAILANRLDVAGAPLMEADFDHENLRGPGYYH